MLSKGGHELETRKERRKPKEAKKMMITCDWKDFGKLRNRRLEKFNQKPGEMKMEIAIVANILLLEIKSQRRRIV